MRESLQSVNCWIIFLYKTYFIVTMFHVILIAVWKLKILQLYHC